MKRINIVIAAFAALALSTAVASADGLPTSGKGLPADFWDVPQSLIEDDNSSRSVQIVVIDGEDYYDFPGGKRKVSDGSHYQS